jgi:hypothetical protein
MSTTLCIKAHRGKSERVAKVSIETEPPTVQEFLAAIDQLKLHPDATQQPPWTVDAIYYESQEAF